MDIRDYLTDDIREHDLREERNETPTEWYDHDIWEICYSLVSALGTLVKQLDSLGMFIEGIDTLYCLARQAIQHADWCMYRGPPRIPYDTWKFAVVTAAMNLDTCIRKITVATRCEYDLHIRLITYQSTWNWRLRGVRDRRNMIHMLREWKVNLECFSPGDSLYRTVPIDQAEQLLFRPHAAWMYVDLHRDAVGTMDAI